MNLGLELMRVATRREQAPIYRPREPRRFGKNLILHAMRDGRARFIGHLVEETGLAERTVGDWTARLVSDGVVEATRIKQFVLYSLANFRG